MKYQIKMIHAITIDRAGSWEKYTGAETSLVPVDASGEAGHIGRVARGDYLDPRGNLRLRLPGNLINGSLGSAPAETEMEVS